ncbi:hypothetical protein L6164_008439 [Bauhinia variegata]|uniref:Uncharacterized protein n=1 Tax=Bauhinia variegata TaxID=167791 RepID=A0ACB9PGL8_BAUVA|nr:hypothetical protein L6164_008439 [Bauhinia variegata]
MKCEREAVKTEHEDDSVQTIVFTAGTILVMLGLKRFLVEQWRAWVFLVLNLILLAIFFMSMMPSCWIMSTRREGNDQEGKVGKMKMKSSCGCPRAEEGAEEEFCKEQYRIIDVNNEENEEEEEEDEDENEEEEEEVSKEELNERVEAFIAMFRQHLVSDAKQADNFRLQEHSRMKAKGLNYSSVLL